MIKQIFSFLQSPIVLLVAVSLLLGGCSFAKAYEMMAPTDQVELTRKVQTMLKEKGFDPGPVDGQSGNKTIAALEMFQKSRGLPSTNGVDAKAFGQLMTMANSKEKSVSGGTIQSKNISDEQKEKKIRQELSFNEPRVKFRATCPGLFIPQIYEKQFQNIIPMYAMRVLNNSDNRYSVKYDMTYTEKTEHYYDKSSGTSTEEEGFVIRPGKFVDILLKKVRSSATSRVTSIDEITVFKCGKT